MITAAPWQVRLDLTNGAFNLNSNQPVVFSVYPTNNGCPNGGAGAANSATVIFQENTTPNARVWALKTSQDVAHLLADDAAVPLPVLD